MENVISFKNVWFRYDARQDWTLREINLTLYEGEWLTIVGGNGSGKSTLVRLINGLLQPTLGEVAVYGKKTCDHRKLWNIRQNVGMVFPNAENQIVGMTVQEDTTFGLYNIGVSPKQAESRCRSVLQLLGLYELKDLPPYFLSGGEKQKLAIAGVLAMEPKVIIVDESTSMLDTESARQIHEIMSELHRNRFTLIQVTHEVEEIFTADRLAVMHKGKIRFDGTPQEAASNSCVFTDSGLLPPFSVRMRDLAKQKGLNLPTMNEFEFGDQ
ncbi:energy-coupling factor transporter ATP-binding protein EcfA1 [Paenibacillus lautus]|uniref:ATP-binding cassette domain-containing protein n=1 Tax=Paenibacillus lautus TaxID=1401 RepID=UPI001B26916C|nr:ATP-binding cassette domain-containing protein [Paenibacillus lautus]GIO95968.1 energy-coupling factor transporter ATP-binding protein EcfA1 [Paenibacillus lautus]